MPRISVAHAIYWAIIGYAGIRLFFLVTSDDKYHDTVPRQMSRQDTRLGGHQSKNSDRRQRKSVTTDRALIGNVFDATKKRTTDIIDAHENIPNGYDNPGTQRRAQSPVGKSPGIVVEPPDRVDPGPAWSLDVENDDIDSRTVVRKPYLILQNI